MLGRGIVGRHAVVVGAEHVSFSAVLTSATRAAAWQPVTDERRHQSYAALRLAATGEGPGTTRTVLTAITAGAPRPSSSRVWTRVPRAASSATPWSSPGTGFPTTSSLAGAASSSTPAPGHPASMPATAPAPGVFAAGNSLHGAETAGVRDGEWVTAAILDWLHAGAPTWPAADAVPVECAPPLRWVSPNAVGRGGAPPWPLPLRSSTFCPVAPRHRRPRQNALAGRLRRTVPTMPVHLRAGWLDRIDPNGGAVHVSVETSSLN